MKSIFSLGGLAIWLVISPQITAQTPLTESKAISYVQNIPISQLDGSLPNRPFGKWLEQTVGKEAGITWQLNDCGIATDAVEAFERDVPACAAVTAVTPEQRTVIVMVLIGSMKLGIQGKPHLHMIVLEEFGQLKELKKLSEIALALKHPPIRPVRKASIALPSTPNRKLPRNAARSTAVPGHETGISDAISERLKKSAELSEAPEPPPPTSAKTRPPLSEGVTLLTPITRVFPVYPVIARQSNASGEVVVRVTTDEKGQVVKAEAIRGHSLLRAAAEEAARKWTFKPTLLNGKPIAGIGMITFRFER